VRQAVAYAIPYQKIMDAVLLDCQADVRQSAGTPTDVAWPQAHPFTRYPKAKQLMAEAATRTDFETQLSFDSLLPASRPSVCLRRKALPRSASSARSQDPGATWRTSQQEISAVYNQRVLGWLDYPEYFFIWCYHGKNSTFHTMSTSQRPHT